MMRSNLWRSSISLLFLGVVTACGGGGGGSSTPAPTSFTLSGTAASGAPFAGATVTLTDSAGATTAGGTTAADGSYSITVSLSAKPPFVIQAARDDQTLTSVAASAQDATLNITPVTTLIASRLSSSGDPAKLAAEIKADPTLVDATKLAAKVAEVVALIKPVMDAVGDSTDPLSGKLVADGSGADKVLDSLSISITPSGATTVDIEIAVKEKLATGAQPPMIGFTNTTTGTLPTLPTITASDLVPSGTIGMIADYLQRLTACFAVAPADRIAAGGTSAADIVASACKDLFLGSDPTKYKNNGAIVSSTGAFAPIFGSASNVTFDRGAYNFTRANGDLVISYRATSSTGNSSDHTLVVRVDTDGKLRAIGNQYQYNGGVNAYHQLRTFVNQPAATYYSTGYNLNVNNVLNAGMSIFDRVEVTTPKGHVLVLKPSAGYSYLPLLKGTTVSGTNYLRLRSVYTDPANAAKNPADADTGLFFANDPTIDDAYIANIPAQSDWKFDYYLAGNTGTTPDATQYYRTLARAMTIAELETQPLAALTDADVAAFKANSLTNASGRMYLPAPATGPVTLDWAVPSGALAPTSLTVFGGGAGGGFNDTTGVASTATAGSIACHLNSKADTHCDAAGNYVSTDHIVGVHLWAADVAGRDFASFYAFYTVTIP